MRGFALLLTLLETNAGWALPAFAGAEGYGCETPGGRGGTVLFVDSLLPCQKGNEDE